MNVWVQLCECVSFSTTALVTIFCGFHNCQNYVNSVNVFFFYVYMYITALVIIFFVFHNSLLL